METQEIKQEVLTPFDRRIKKEKGLLHKIPGLIKEDEKDSDLKEVKVQGLNITDLEGYKVNPKRIMPFEEKVLVGTLAHFESSREVAERFGIHHDFVREIKAGTIGRDNIEKREELQDAIQSSVKAKKELIQNSALDKIIMLVDGIDSSQVVKQRDKASIAKDLSITTKNIFGEERSPFSAKVTIYSPGESKESRYDEIEISTR